MSTVDDAEYWRLCSILADQLDAYPVETWPEPLVAAVVGVLGLYAADRPKATAPPVLKLVPAVAKGAISVPTLPTSFRADPNSAGMEK